MLDSWSSTAGMEARGAGAQPLTAADHRRHAIIEQAISDLKNGPLAHLPSVHGQLGVADAGRDGVQPRRPDHPLRPPRNTPTTHQLAVGKPISETHHRRHRSAETELTPTPMPHRQKNSWTNWTSRASTMPRTEIRRQHQPFRSSRSTTRRDGVSGFSRFTPHQESLTYPRTQSTRRVTNVPGFNT